MRHCHSQSQVGEAEENAGADAEDKSDDVKDNNDDVDDDDDGDDNDDDDDDDVYWDNENCPPNQTEILRMKIYDQPKDKNQDQANDVENSR